MKIITQHDSMGRLIIIECEPLYADDSWKQLKLWNLRNPMIRPNFECGFGENDIKTALSHDDQTGQ